MESYRLNLLMVMFCTILPSAMLRNSDRFSEEMLVRPLPNGMVYSHFQFTTTWDIDLKGSDQQWSHYRLFPKALGEVLAAYSVQELHLSFTQGVWRHSDWGYPVIDTPPGAELWVWFQNDTKDVDRTWSDLTNALSGLFCASLNFIDEKSTVSPRWSFRPSGISGAEHAADSHYVRYSALPGEIVCTENLTPWKKLLPCNSKVGLTTLFNAIRLYDANFHSLGLHVRPVCKTAACDSPAVELSQSLAVVFDAVRINGNSQQLSWSLKQAFSRSLSGTCPLSDQSTIYAELPALVNPRQLFRWSPGTEDTLFIRSGDQASQFGIYDIATHTKGGNQLNLELDYNQALTYITISPPVLHAHRFITGYGLERGGIRCHLHNNMKEDVKIIYMETLPWFTRLYISSLSIQRDGVQIKPSAVHFEAGKDRVRPYFLEIVLTLRAQSITTISFTFDRAFLMWTEYPPDANHGFYINSAVVSAMLPSSAHVLSAARQGSSRLRDVISNKTTPAFVRIHTESLLVSLPTPDFSMPYNVICLACTVVAIAFGSIHNLTTRHLRVTDPKEKKGLLNKLKGFLRWKSKKEVKAEQTEESKDETIDKQSEDNKKDYENNISDENLEETS